MDANESVSTAASDSPTILTAADYRGLAGFDPPLFRAAANHDSRILLALLNDGVRFFESFHGWKPDLRDIGMISNPNVSAIADEYGYWASTPLLQAVQAGLLENVKILSQAGAEPDGVLLTDLIMFAAHKARMYQEPIDVIRIIEADEEEVRLGWLQDPAQLQPITQREIGDRCNLAKDVLVPFWGPNPVNFREQERWNSNDGQIPYTSLIWAARTGLQELFDILLDAGADTSRWRISATGEVTAQLTAKLTCSQATTTLSPLHAAVLVNDLSMISFLLRKGFNPNITPSVNIPEAVSPLMLGIMKLNVAALNLFLSAPSVSGNDTIKADLSLLTPFAQVHSLHIACATLDVEILKLVAEYIEHQTPSTNKWPVTALGHTLLHVACLPQRSSDLRERCAEVAESIHELRTLTLPEFEHFITSSNSEKPDETWPSWRRIRTDIPSWEMSASTSEEEIASEWAKQSAMVEYLIEQYGRSLPLAAIVSLVEKQDVHGNTALHYLASHHTPNHILIDKLMGRTSKDSWTSLRNRHGYTAQDLCTSQQNSDI